MPETISIKKMLQAYNMRATAIELCVEALQKPKLSKDQKTKMVTLLKNEVETLRAEARHQDSIIIQMAKRT